MVKYYLVPEEDLADLMTDSLTLQALDCYGVDNWAWYGASINDFINAAKVDYNVPEDDTDFDIRDMAEVDMQGYKSVEVNE